MNLLNKVVQLKRQASSVSNTKASTASCSSDGASSVRPCPMRQARKEDTVAPSTRVVRGTGGGRRTYATPRLSNADKCRAIEAALETSSSISDFIGGSRHPVVRPTYSKAQRSHEVESVAGPSQTDSTSTAQQLGGGRHPIIRSRSVVEIRHVRKDTKFAKTLEPSTVSPAHVASYSLASAETSSYFDEIPEMARRISLPRQSTSESSEPMPRSGYSASTYSINSLPLCEDEPPGRGRFSVQSFDSAAASTYSAELASAKIVPLYRTYASSQVILPYQLSDSIVASSHSAHHNVRNYSFPTRSLAAVPILPPSPLKTAPPTPFPYQPPPRHRVLQKRKKKYHYKPFHIALEDGDVRQEDRVGDMRNALNGILYSPASFKGASSTLDVSYYPRVARPNSVKEEPPSKPRANTVDRNVQTEDNRSDHSAFISRQHRPSLDNRSVKEERRGKYEIEDSL
jgi:hypothetical protein